MVARKNWTQMAQMMRIGYDFLRLGFHPSVAGLGGSEGFTWSEALTGKLRAGYESALKGQGGIWQLPGAWFKRPKVLETLWGLLDTPAGKK
jgi:hypothetical protein